MTIMAIYVNETKRYKRLILCPYKVRLIKKKEKKYIKIYFRPLIQNQNKNHQKYVECKKVLRY